MAAVDQVGPGVYAGVGQLHLGVGGPVFQLAAPVEHAHYVIHALALKVGNGGQGLVLVGDVGAAGAYGVPVPGGVDAHLYAAGGGNDLSLLILAVSHSYAVQGGLGVLQTGVVKVHGVVVGDGDEVHPAFRQYLYPLGRAEEVELGVDGVLQFLIGEAALQVPQGQLVVGEVLEGVGKGITVVPVHLGGIVGGTLLREVLVGGKGHVSDAGDGKIFRLRLRGGLRGGGG